MRLAVVMAMACVASYAAPFDQAERLFGPADLNAIAGHGGLTVGVNRSGRITTCRWPSPGYYEHIQYTTSSRSEPLLGVAPSDGAGWAVQIGDQLLWMHDDRWIHAIVPETRPGVIEIASRLVNTDVEVSQQIAVSKDRDSFAARAIIRGTGGTAPNVFWYANFSPSTRLMPELPVRLWARDDFAAFHDASGAICHLRPGDPSSYAWYAARELAERHAPRQEWQLDNGVYIVHGVSGQPVSWSIGNEDGAGSVIDQIQAAKLTGLDAMTGATASAFQVPVAEEDGAFAATVFAAFGENAGSAFERFEQTRTAGFSGLHGNVANNDVEWIKQKAFATIAVCTDRATGSVVRAPIAQPPMALDSPRYGVWTAMAHDLAGRPDAARPLLEFYLDHVRESGNRDYPIGPIPAALYPNGTTGVPDAIIDAAAAGRLLWMLELHGATSEESDRSDLYRRHWKAIEMLADFLALWRAPGGRGPLYTFDYDALRDRRTPELFAASHLGMRAAVRIASVLDEPRPDWQKAATELDVAMRQKAVAADILPEAFWDTEFLNERTSELEPAYVEQALTPGFGNWDTNVLHRLTLSCLAHPLFAPAQRTALAARVRAHLEHQTPDSADAAFAYIIAHRLTQMEDTARRPIPITPPETP